MDYITVYEYNIGESNLLHLIPLFFLSLFGFGLALYLKKHIRTFSYFRQYIIFFCYMLGGIPSIMLIVMLFNSSKIIKNEKRLKEIIENKSYEVVEGEIEDFSHYTKGGHIFERFNVQGVKFEYSDYILNEGYHKTSINGGLIEKNGQQVKISYITKDNENLILKLEIKKGE